MNIMITGAAGFIGSHLCERLVQDGHKVIGFENFTGSSIDPRLKWGNIESILWNERFSLYEGDIRKREDIERPFFRENIDAVIHLAAQTGVRPSVQDPALHYKTNVLGLLNVLQLCKIHGVKKFVFASSSSVYGDSSKIPFEEDDKVDSPLSPYAATKKAGENLCHVFHTLYNMDVTCLRPFTVYGPRQRKDMAISLFTRKLYAGEPITIFGDETNSRDYTYVSDVVEGFVLALYNLKGFEVYNIGGGKPVSLKCLVELIEIKLGTKAIVNHTGLQLGEAHHTFACIEKAKEQLGYTVSVGIGEGLSKYIEWFKKEVGNVV